MALVLIGKGLALEGFPSKTEVIGVPGAYTHPLLHIYTAYCTCTNTSLVHWEIARRFTGRFPQTWQRLCIQACPSNSMGVTPILKEKKGSVPGRTPYNVLWEGNRYSMNWNVTTKIQGVCPTEGTRAIFSDRGAIIQARIWQSDNWTHLELHSFLNNCLDLHWNETHKEDCGQWRKQGYTWQHSTQHRPSQTAIRHPCSLCSLYWCLMSFGSILRRFPAILWSPASLNLFQNLIIFSGAGRSRAASTTSESARKQAAAEISASFWVPQISPSKTLSLQTGAWRVALNPESSSATV